MSYVQQLLIKKGHLLFKLHSGHTSFVYCFCVHTHTSWLTDKTPDIDNTITHGICQVSCSNGFTR